ncbi:hypothetical protein DH2020_013014 [Rehmannia glutinosa]|uniref:Pectinesterase inhibitor domain-containing protein n=1 Tax=Rehmannia glutinosa TaxID=99300 RepID=A0ABR0X4W1_REHGL
MLEGSRGCVSELPPTFKSTKLDDVCRQNKNPPLCLKTLASDPKFRNATLSDLAEIGFQTAGLDAVKIQRKFLSLLNSPTLGSKLRAIYAECEKLYVDASAKLVAANNDFRGR